MQKNGFTTCCKEGSLDLILLTIGLDPSTFNGKLIDVGCGRSGNLVRYLRKMGIYAEGIDPLLEEPTNYLIRSEVPPIPRPDNCYDFALSNSVFSSSYERLNAHVTDTVHDYPREQAVNAIREVIRVLKPHGRYVIYPESRKLVQQAMQDIENVGLIREHVFPQKLFDILDPDSRKMFEALDDSAFEESFYRTVLTKLR